MAAKKSSKKGKEGAREAFKGTIEVAFDYNGGTRYNIESGHIVYIMIESNYLSDSVIPVVFMSINVNSKMYSMITESNKTSKFYLKIEKTNVMGNVPITKKVLEGAFSYVTSATSPNITDKLNSTNKGETDNSFRSINVGLVQTEMIDLMRKSFDEGVYRDTDQNTLLGLALEGLPKVVIETPQYNEPIKQEIYKPSASRYRFIEQIFNMKSFYDTRYTFFMDFDRTYLLSQKGNAVDAGDGDCNSIIIEIGDVDDRETFYSGFKVENGAYRIRVNASDTNVVVNEGTEKVTNNIVAIDDEKSLQDLKLNMNNTAGSATKPMYVRSRDAAILKNSMENDTVLVEIMKQNIDSTVFTPNKEINVNHYGKYAKYNGRYLLNYKREFYKMSADQFTVTCNVGLKKVNSNEVSGAESDNYTTDNPAVSPSASISSSSNKAISYPSRKASR